MTLHHFSPLPRRAFQDKRLRLRHFRVLGAIASAVNAETCCSTISQEAVAKRAGTTRRIAREAIRDLTAWSYITPIDRGRTAGGRMLTKVYEINYTDALDHGPSLEGATVNGSHGPSLEGATVHGPSLEGAIPMDPSKGGPESDLPLSDLSLVQRPDADRASPPDGGAARVSATSRAGTETDGGAETPRARISPARSRSGPDRQPALQVVRSDPKTETGPPPAIRRLPTLALKNRAAAMRRVAKGIAPQRSARTGKFLWSPADVDEVLHAGLLDQADAEAVREALGYRPPAAARRA